jgi:hypothetical protein
VSGWYRRIEPEAVVVRSWLGKERRIPIVDVEGFFVLPQGRDAVESTIARGISQRMVLRLNDGHRVRVFGFGYKDLDRKALDLNNTLARYQGA